MCRLAFVPLTVLGVCIPVYAKTILVDLNGGGDCTEIQPAIEVKS